MTARVHAELEDAIARIIDRAGEAGLDFFDMRFEICPADIIYTFGAYGMPIRFSHWSFGKAFHRMKMDHDYGLARIYELVINSDPCYAFLLDTNTLLQNKMIAAHVVAHCDFFKNNWRFRDTNRKMVWTMAAFAGRVRQYEQEYGRDRVERFLDAVLAIHEHVDPLPDPDRGAAAGASRDGAQRPGGRAAGSDQDPYGDLWNLDRYIPAAAAPAEAPRPEGAGPGARGDASRGEPPRAEAGARGAARRPTRDLLLFLLERAPDLEDWQRDILSSVRSESLYFRPQLETRIMNEGWASLWHARIMRDLDLTPEESLEFARMHAAVLAPSRFHLNPYHLGLHIFSDIEARYGTEKLFEVREVDTDVSFIRNYLTRDLVERLDLYLFRKNGDRWEVTRDHSDWEAVRDGLVRLISNCGFPYIYAEDHDYQKRGELYLRHGYEGVELDPHDLTRTLPHVYHIWGRPVHLETVEGDRPVRYTYDGHEVQRRPL
ncbi:SpoVR family protein [Caldinitratiruptor microaerophilus]|uniref:Stage V sporulation protein R n=1 Tax=Caldinitratiruptor microaerophilus TaxID=671077 RepID=A0AA35CQC9_9FIRM|nr:SpoVR family protein [Caldinitratiruptor microaerophilus]BDG62021.1 stage V sporulation protein R [Caldinitratiruptor microaerophilus]